MVRDNFIHENTVKQCNECKHLHGVTATCKAYPTWIPDGVLDGEGCPDFEMKGKNEEKPGTIDRIACAEHLAQAMRSMKGKPLPTDFDELDSQMTEEITEKLHRKRKTPKES